MEFCDYLVIGGGVAGTTAAETVREHDAARSIAIVSDEPHPLYSRILLPAYVKGEIERAQLFLRKPEDYAARRIDLITGEAAALDAGRRAVRLADGRALDFGKLLIAGGGRPRPLGVPGESMGGVARLQTIADADRARELLAEAKRAVVIGASFIALEFLEILRVRGIATALVFPGDHFFGRHLDEAGGRFLDERLGRAGASPIRSGQAPAAIEGAGAMARVRTSSGAELKADFVGVGVGLERSTAWLADSGVGLTARGVAADEYLETNVPGIFAAGDIADFNDILTGQRSIRGNWSNATLAGRAAGANMVRPEAKQAFAVVPTYGVRGMGLAIGLVGDTVGSTGTESVGRAEANGESFARFLFHGDRLVGAALINHSRQLRSRLAELIYDRRPLPSAARSRIADPSVDVLGVLA